MWTPVVCAELNARGVGGTGTRWAKHCVDGGWSPKTFNAISMVYISMVESDDAYLNSSC